MKKFLHDLTFGACIILSGCGGGGDVQPTSPFIDSTITNDNSSTTNELNFITYSTADVLCNIDQNIYNSDESVNTTSDASWTCTDATRALNSNGIPDHEVGTFPNAENPNSISVQNVQVDFTLSPKLISDTGVSVKVTGYALNGVKFDPGTAGSCSDSGTCSLVNPSGGWSIEALGQTSFDFGDDMNNAHVQPEGAYHYHGMPERYLELLNKGEAMTLVGWTVDGFPLYARFAYNTADDANSGIKVMASSWQLKGTPDEGRLSTDLYPMGAFRQDYEYVAGLGDLDECNGRTGVTPEFPDGIYYLMVTDGYPFVGRCLKGEFTESRPPQP